MSYAEVAPALRAEAALDTVRVANRGLRRPRAFTSRDALIALSFEASFVFVYACNLRDGVDLEAGDHDRLALACNRIQAIAEEAAA